MAVDPVESYLKDLSEVWRSGGGVAEESYYGALQRLLDEIGKKLKPRVRCVPQLKNTGAGEPDFGLFTADQFQRAKDTLPIEGQLPARGVIECKPWNDDSFARSQGAQVSNYWKRYNLVLVTNYRDFVLIGRDDAGKPLRLESFRLAGSENAFHAMLAHPHKASHEHGERLAEFLRRVMLHAAPLTEPEDLAWFLASYAREARFRVEEKADLPALEGLKKALEDALGMKFEGDKGEHFFRATLVQTLFYGVFSSWVLWSRENRDRPGYKFRWHDTAWTLHVPMIASLFEQIATPKRLQPLGIDEVLDRAGVVLNRVDRSAFFSKFEDEHAVQYFYEPFLKAYDPELRKELGVWYTPPEIVQYQVERVDRVLREELDVPDGLADDQVVILDPCCGTGAYLVETLKRIHKTLLQKGRSALTAQKLKKAAMERVFGFEILPAPFVISHLQIGLMLRRLDAPLHPDGTERAGVYLTNALTGWEPATEPKKQLPLFPELTEERDKANHVKQETPILVILGNPPYNAFAGTSPEEEGGLVDVYKEGLTTHIEKGGWGIKKFNLDDLYVRFFRIAERRIAKSGRGIVSYISNFSYLAEPSFVAMRQHLLAEFDKVWIDCMNGDSRETGKLTPDGQADPSVFSTEHNREGIRVGTAICLVVRRPSRMTNPTVRFRHFWGSSKRTDLLDTLARKDSNTAYVRVDPQRQSRFSLRPECLSQSFRAWPKVSSLCAIEPTLGVLDNRQEALIRIDRHEVEARARAYLDRTLPFDEIARLVPELARNYARFHAAEARVHILEKGGFSSENIRRVMMRPMDTRWCYHSTVRPLWVETRPKLIAQCWEDNAFIVTRNKAAGLVEGLPLFYTRALGMQHAFHKDAYYIPLRLKPETDDSTRNLYGRDDIRSNVSEGARWYLSGIGVEGLDDQKEQAELLWMHVLSIGYSPAYLVENADGIRRDWPRIPLPAKKKALMASATLGRQIAALLDTENAVEGVTTGKTDARLRDIGVICRVEGGSLDPDQGHLDVTAGWGHAGKDGVCMPGADKAQMRFQDDEELRRVFGDETLDVYLNQHAYWSNVPKAVWEYRIGGYQVVKKWLSYREKALFGRGLKVEEAEYVTEMARRIASLILMQSELDANYEAVKADTYPWPQP